MRESQHGGESLLLTWKVEGATWQKYKQLLGPEAGPWLTACKLGSQSYKCKELNSANDLNDLESGFFSRPSRELGLDRCHGTLSRKPSHTVSDF